MEPIHTLDKFQLAFPFLTKKNRFLLQQQKDEMGQKDPYTQVHVTKQKCLHFMFFKKDV